MGTNLNKQAYTKMIEENITEMDKYMPDSLEKRHIVDVLKWSICELYKEKESELKEKTAWISVKDGYPPNPTPLKYRQIPCLVYRKNEIELLAWNCAHLCWDTSDLDDYECDFEDVTHYMYLPSPPQKPIK